MLKRTLTGMNLTEVGDLGEGMRVTEGNEDDAVVGQGGEGVHNSGLLTTTMGSG